MFSIRLSVPTRLVQLGTLGTSIIVVPGVPRCIRSLGTRFVLCFQQVPNVPNVPGKNDMGFMIPRVEEAIRTPEEEQFVSLDCLQLEAPRE